MTYKQIEQSREIRLWIGQIIIPAFTVGATILASDPGFRSDVAKTFGGIKKSIKRKFTKEKES